MQQIGVRVRVYFLLYMQRRSAGQHDIKGFNFEFGLCSTSARAWTDRASGHRHLSNLFHSLFFSRHALSLTLALSCS